MATKLLQENQLYDPVDVPEPDRLERTNPGLLAAYRLCGAIAALMVVVSAIGLFVEQCLSRRSVGS